MSSTQELEAVLASAEAVAPRLRAGSGTQRAGWLRAAGAALEARRAELVDLAVQETHLPHAALDGELTRTVFQLEHFARTAESPELLGVVVESADPDYPVAPRPGLVQALRPLGPVLVFTASNFPFAFSVAGNDTASALAAGCPVVVKANPGHPRLSARTAEVVVAALREAGAPDGTVGHIEGVEAGVAALRDPRIAACGFTGSVAGGRALFDIAVSRPDPIPFYGELGSLNPVYVTPAAAAARAEEIASGFAASFTFRGGQLCTKPGVLFAPTGSGIAAATAAAIGTPEPVELLTDRITSAYLDGTRRLASSPGAIVHAGGDTTAATLVSVSAAAVLDSAVELQECFGPAAVVVEYDDPAQLPLLANRIGPSLTATIHGEPGDDVAADLAPGLTELVGRVIWNGWPTGVAVTRALHHGGPYPATTSPTYGSIGAGAERRWLRPVSYQNWPVELLPEPVRAVLAD
ncbi:aldehyde dehydrogenase family protein [Allokutzneria sp. A3M-2-11 16]|uniref:aldehyde dehydrogenase family protein n=1 Tax=Allokutzneria sp. A3M-2-11 16 TaxID=2962043 RepID=UPI0020B7C323|nr:aldehyde dehydrogenase family protein [Allokutzneria sp. A3M-2-11 16]MCP3801981.1 aldehyde dehydrogenase family protein [Allokutzneria sp. A3M-2-11 16]